MSIQESITQLNDGRIAGFRVIEITESPSIEILPQFLNIIQAQQSNQLALMNQLSSLSREVMRICEGSAYQTECSFEFSYSTAPVQNQRYRASIRMFYIIRVISKEQNELINLIDQIIKRFESSLVASEYSYVHINTEDYCNLLHEKICTSAQVVLKDDRIHNLQSPTLPQCFSFDRIGALDYTKKNLYYSLVQHPHCYLSIQLIPAQYSGDEKNLIAGNSQLLDNLLKGVSDQGSQIAISYTAARKDAQTYAYYADFAEEGIYLFNILVMGTKEGVADLTRSVIQEYSGGSEFRTILKSMPLDLLVIDVESNLATFPWLLIDETRLHNSTSAAKQFSVDYSIYSRLPYLVSCEEAATLFLLPIGDHHIGSGLMINESKQANRTYAEDIIDGGDVTIGSIKASTHNKTIGIKLKDLTKHMLVVGTPGSGKTTFLIGLLDRLWKEHKIPFLVIEPAKNEYRAMLSTIADLQIFTPGKSDISPFVFNPFSPPTNVKLETFKPTLLTAFSAAVSMSSPLDKIFEESINECYGNFGWFDHYTTANLGEIFNISDFIQCFERQFELIGYTGDARNIGRAGVVRLKSIANLFESYYSIPIEHLIERPTVIELNGIESSDQKALVIALLLLSILSYINSNRLGDGKLKNIILLEEAHVLMDAQSGNRLGEADPASIAKRLIRRMLAEIRSYGTGMILADQSPRKVGVDIVALTDIKMAFRLVEAEDKQMIANSTSMNEAQIARLSNFKPGEACLYFGRLDEPEEVKVPDYREIHKIDISLYDEDLKALTTYWKENAMLMRPYPECRVVKECADDCIIVTKMISKEVARRIHHRHLSQRTISLEAVKNVLYNVKKLILQELNEEPCTPRMIECATLHLLRMMRYQNLIKRNVNNQAERPYQISIELCTRFLSKEKDK